MNDEPCTSSREHTVCKLQNPVGGCDSFPRIPFATPSTTTGVDYGTSLKYTCGCGSGAASTTATCRGKYGWQFTDHFTCRKKKETFIM